MACRGELWYRPRLTESLGMPWHYLREHDWKCAMDKASQLRVILAYNKSAIYANTVLAIAEKLTDQPRIKR